MVLFNGNLVLDKTVKRFKVWLRFYNTTDVFSSYTKKLLLFDSKKPPVRFDNAWLSGFTQAEGGFYLGIEKRYDRNSKKIYSNYRFVKKYHLAQQDELCTLKQIRNMFYEQILNNKQPLNLNSKKYILTQKTKKVDQLQLTTKPFIFVILLYFDQYPFYGKKKRQYYQWKRFVKKNLLKSCDSELKIQQFKHLIQLYRKQ